MGISRQIGRLGLARLRASREPTRIPGWAGEWADVEG
jgi:hypothetical protein